MAELDERPGLEGQMREHELGLGVEEAPRERMLGDGPCGEDEGAHEHLLRLPDARDLLAYLGDQSARLAHQHGLHDGVFVPEASVEGGPPDACSFGDGVDGGAAQPEAQEELVGRVEDALGERVVGADGRGAAELRKEGRMGHELAASAE
jgi:hypothetical protein